MSYDAAYAHQYDSRPVKAMSDSAGTSFNPALICLLEVEILDIGYGNGAFLKHAESAGMSIFGIDLHTEDFGVPVVNFDTPQEYDLICFFTFAGTLSEFCSHHPAEKSPCNRIDSEYA